MKLVTRFLLIFQLLLVFVISQFAFGADDPLPSWNEGAAKKALLAYVADVTKQGGPKFVAPDKRIATFDNDGTLWAEQPMYFQLAFGIDRVKALAPQHPEWKTQEPFKSVLEGNIKAALAGGEKAAFALMAPSHVGMTTEAFNTTVVDWIATAKNPKFNRLYIDCTYQPQLELLAYLRANGFKTFIVSGGGIDFMRPWTEKAYGIPPEQVVGSSVKVQYELKPNYVPVLMRLADINFIDDGPGKPVGIHQYIGRKPILAFGNSDGDQQMLEYTDSGTGPKLMLILHHDDAAREVAYDRQSPIGHLDKAWDEAVKRGWIVVSMKNDFKTVFKK
jgi:phosphoglycolate phosphatase-like HAD superfamily hydrolase